VFDPARTVALLPKLNSQGGSALPSSSRYRERPHLGRGSSLQSAMAAPDRHRDEDMPSSVTSVFSEPGDFEAALREDGVLSTLVTGRGQFRARLTQLTLHRLRLLAAEEHLPRIAFVAVPADAVLVLLPISNGASPIWGGIGMRAGEIITLGPDHRAHARTDGPCRWGTIRLPARDLARYGRALSGAGFAVPQFVARWRPPPAARRELRQLHRAAIRATENRPGVLIDAEAAHGLEQQLIDALVECLSAESAEEATSAARWHQDAVVRFERLFEAQRGWNLRMAEICAALGVSERLLRNLCAEHLGMSPTSYLRLHRISLAHRALGRGDSAAASVSEVARRYGFRHFGRFAADYHALFGELPSATLQRSLHPGMAHLALLRPRRLL
jgi:AraC-like DNA-binding protein